MKKEIDCQIFEDQLDELLNGSLPDEGMGQLQHHALSCPDCAMLLRVKEHLTLPPLEELEAAVPEDLLASVWGGVQAGIKAQPEVVPLGAPAGSSTNAPDVPAGTSGTRRFGWAIPALAAASIALLFSTGFLFSELRQTQVREQQLAQQVVAIDRWLVDLDGESGLFERTAALAGRGKHRGRALEHALAGQDQVELATLIEMLGDLPEGEILFNASQVDALKRVTSRPSPEMREILAILDEVLPGLERAGDVRAGDLAEWLAESELPTDLLLPKSPLIELFS